MVRRQKNRRRVAVSGLLIGVCIKKIRNLGKGKRCQMWFTEGKRLGSQVIYLERIAEGDRARPQMLHTNERKYLK